MIAKSTTLLLLIVFVIVACIVYLASSNRSNQSALSSGPQARDATSGEGESVQAVLATPARALPEGVKTVGEYLEAYWGSDWPNRQQQYSAINMQAPLSDFSLAEWSSVQNQLRETARSYYERDLETLRVMFLGRFEDNESFASQFGIGEADKANVLSGLKYELAEIDVQLDSLSLSYVAELDIAMQLVFQEPSEAFPLADLRSRTRVGSAHTIHVEGGGWFASYRCDFSRFPRLALIDEERNRIQGERMVLALAYIRRRARGG